jgi:CheY-like chemotaxis protein
VKNVAFVKGNPITLHVVNDGVEAMAFLRKDGAYRFVPRPQLILLDLNLPKMNGREVLTQIKNDSALSAIPTIVLTVSDNPDDIQYCYEKHVNAYVIKPGDLDAFNHLADVVNKFWFTLTTFPGVMAAKSQFVDGPDAL